jgi:hypothetical protein
VRCLAANVANLGDAGTGDHALNGEVPVGDVGQRRIAEGDSDALTDKACYTLVGQDQTGCKWIGPGTSDRRREEVGIGGAEEKRISREQSRAEVTCGRVQTIVRGIENGAGGPDDRL